jgi:hypothetical protein
LRDKARGTRKSPQRNGAALHRGIFELRADVAEWLVRTWTVAVPVMFAFTASLAGLKLQAAFAGSELHANVNVPDEPFNGVRAMVKFAVCPLATVWLGAPDKATVKSKPIPDNCAC